MKQPEGFFDNKAASRQCYLKFDNVITSYGFEENVAHECVYLKISRSKFIILVLCVDDILLSSCDLLWYMLLRLKHRNFLYFDQEN